MASTNVAKRITSNGERVLFVVHRRELVKQIKNTFSSWGVNMNLCEIYMVQTASRRLEKLMTPNYILFLYFVEIPAQRRHRLSADPHNPCLTVAYILRSDSWRQL